MSNSVVIDYFGKDTVEQAIADYFNRRGLTPVIRDELITISRFMEDQFFEIVDDFVYNKG